jgi:hypothetical protein
LSARAVKLEFHQRNELFNGSSFGGPPLKRLVR